MRKKKFDLCFRNISTIEEQNGGIKCWKMPKANIFLFKNFINANWGSVVNVLISSSNQQVIRLGETCHQHVLNRNVVKQFSS